jgi:hypothetical protein
MKLSKSIFTVAVIALALSACAKKDSEFAARYAVNAAGASGVDAGSSGEADKEAIAAGVSQFDVLNVTNNGSSNGQVITALLIVNGKQKTVSTTHNTLQLHTGSDQADGGFRIVYNVVCGSQACNPVYIAAEIYRGNESVAIKQVGYRKYFNMDAKLDRYQFFKGKDAKKLIAGNTFDYKDMNDTSVMVGYLNQNLSSYVK